MTSISRVKEWADGPSSVTAGLSAEHRLVLRELDAFERSLRDEDLVRARETFRFFDEKVSLHRRKEEEVLFPALAAYPRIADGPVACMLAEHREERGLLDAARNAAVRAADAPDAWADLRRSGSALVALLRQHIDKEDNVLFPVAESTLADTEKDVVCAGFDRIGYFHASPEAVPGAHPEEGER